MTHGSLFSGMGGFDLAAEWAGWTNAFHCEWNEFGQKVLKYYWPQAESFSDITKTNFSKYENKIDVLTGGFPCQPYSTAGKRRGKDDERHLWPEMCRAIREIKPRWIVGENVFGLVNWSNGLVFHEVQTDLENEGYEVQPFLLPAAAVNAPHRRDRIWFIAYSNNNGQHRCNSQYEINAGKRGVNAFSNIIKGNDFRIASDTMCNRGRESRQRGQSKQFNQNGTKRSATIYTENNRQPSTLQNKKLERGRFGQSDKRNFWDTFPTVSPLCTGNDGLSYKLDGITFSKWRNESIKAAGNAIVPQVALQIFNAINEFENFNPGTGVSEQL